MTGEAATAPAPNLLRRLYDRVVRAADGPRATLTLFGVSFAESSFFPVPPDVILLPMMLARRDRVWRLAAICTIASVLGGLLGYAIGHLLYDTIGRWIIEVVEGLDVGRVEHDVAQRLPHLQPLRISTRHVALGRQLVVDKARQTCTADLHLP